MTMHWPYLWVAPFIEFDFMRRALVGTVALALGCGPVGVFLTLRRMSLMGDAMSHAVLPGVAIGFLLAGLNMPAMSLGGFIAGVVVIVAAGLVTRFTDIREDASLAAFYLMSLALGVLLVSHYGNSVDLMHILFGSVLAVDDSALLLVASIATVSMAGMALIYRPLLLDTLDPTFLPSVGTSSTRYYLIFMVLVVLNLVAGFQALGTLMAVGLMMIPAVTARLWVRSIGKMVAVAVLCALLAGYGGLLLSFYLDFPSGPAIVLLAGVFYSLSLLIAPQGGILLRVLQRSHLQG